jgi:glucose-1-phosphate cytidylyltransferase
MKVVLFAGGQGIRIREYSERVPKPMVPVGNRPILWHNMKYFAHFGHTEFVLCLGYQAEVIKQYFLRYDECVSNDFVLSPGRQVQLVSSDIDAWRITFADTGLHANIGQRLVAARKYLGNDDMFLANYGDVLSNAPLNEFVEEFSRSDKLAAFLSVRPSYSFHVVSVAGDGRVDGIEPVADADIWLNGGFFIFRREIFDYIYPGDELVEEPFRRLIADRRLMTFRYNGFWAPMDTIKDQQILEDMYNAGQPPWALWAQERRD